MTCRSIEAENAVFRDTSENLRAALLRTEEWRFRRDGWAAIDEGLLRSYRRGRKAFRKARAQPTVETLHDWRKRAKDLWYHLRWLRRISPRTMCGHAADAHRLADLLGDDHDLAALRDSLIGMTGVPADVGPVVGLIDHRREQLQTEAMFLGQRLYAEAPKQFLRRLHRYWKAWRSETRAAASHHAGELAEATHLELGAHG